MEPCWEEALDADDSDLQSLTLLRPCKQQRRHDESNPSINTHLSLSQTLDSSKSPSQTVGSLLQKFTPAYQAEAPPPFRTIPGPAGIVQAAKLRKSRDNENLLGHEEPPMATQEYIRRVVEDPEEDDDFNRSPWLSAIEFVYADGMFNSVPNAPLGDIHKHLKKGKLEQVVAVIKSCTPNELGDLMVSLKDPTGAVSGTIHHKVLTEGEFGKGILVGSVLILHKVSVFSPSKATHYLNITNRNLVKGTRTFSLEQIAKKMANVTKTTTNTQQNQHIDIDNDQENVNPIVSTGPHSTETLKESNVTKSPAHLEPAMVSGSLPVWTDEQLNELFDNFEDDF
ncbi:hypothetical protein L2E82_36101 [Cichorium intybus]|uniref:Uncharacterized protein n=1 Tax=Cichorium intybus TaxID=13427 RepID=A0ACB9BQZ5_CICIN|nr:hypothetical protein L2E82_36101 [Cichorium intybus]